LVNELNRQTTKVVCNGHSSGYLVSDLEGRFNFYFEKGQVVELNSKLADWLEKNGHFGEGKLKVVH
jgi:hypothetical protein